jgi:hypothetical protein
MYRAMSARVDLVALHAEEYAAGRAPRLVATSPARYLAIDGAGDIAGGDFVAQAGALARLLRDVRDRARREVGMDFKLPPLEALLGAPRAPSPRPPPAGEPAPWRLLLRVPAFVEQGHLAAAGREDAARLEQLREGRCVQLLHVGPLHAAATAIDRLRRAAADLDLALRGRLHVLVLTAPGRTAPERGRTVLRVPVRPR